MGLQLAPRRARVFDEVNDIIGCDLVLVMDSFDATEVGCEQERCASTLALQQNLCLIHQRHCRPRPVAGHELL